MCNNWARANLSAWLCVGVFGIQLFGIAKRKLAFAISLLFVMCVCPSKIVFGYNPLLMGEMSATALFSIVMAFLKWTKCSLAPWFVGTKPNYSLHSLVLVPYFSLFVLLLLALTIAVYSVYKWCNTKHGRARARHSSELATKST